MWFWENTQTPSFSKTWTVVNGGIITQVKRKEHDGPPPCSGGWGEVTGDHLTFQGGLSPTHPRTHIRSRYSRGTHTVGDYIPRPLGTCVVSRDSLVMGAGMSELWLVRKGHMYYSKKDWFFWKQWIRWLEIMVRKCKDVTGLKHIERLESPGKGHCIVPASCFYLKLHKKKNWVYWWAESSTSNF